MTISAKCVSVTTQIVQYTCKVTSDWKGDIKVCPHLTLSSVIIKSLSTRRVSEDCQCLHFLNLPNLLPLECEVC